MFNINGEDWTIKLVSNNHPAIQRKDGFFTLGCCDNLAKTIYIVTDEILANKRSKFGNHHN